MDHTIHHPTHENKFLTRETRITKHETDVVNAGTQPAGHGGWGLAIGCDGGSSDTSQALRKNISQRGFDWQCYGSASRSPQGSIRLGTASPFGLYQRVMEEVVEAVCSGR